MTPSHMVSVDISGRLPSGVTRKMVVNLVDASFVAGGGKGKMRVDLSVVDDKVMRGFNRQHRGVDSTTDVLSFPYADKDFPSADGDAGGLLGEIVISAPRVRKQAKEAGRTIREEFALMVVHGTLHLLGYDHCTEKEEQVMFRPQQDILDRILFG